MAIAKFHLNYTNSLEVIGSLKFKLHRCLHMFHHLFCGLTSWLYWHTRSRPNRWSVDSQMISIILSLRTPIPLQNHLEILLGAWWVTKFARLFHLLNSYLYRQQRTQEEMWWTTTLFGRSHLYWVKHQPSHSLGCSDRKLLPTWLSWWVIRL